MGSNEHELRPIPTGDPLANEARREVRAKERCRQLDTAHADMGLWLLAQQMARASAAMAAKDDSGVMGGAI